MQTRGSALQLAWLFLWLLVAGVFGASARAQCATQWLPGDGVPGTNGEVYATTMWDRDGPGPMQPVVVVGGLSFYHQMVPIELDPLGMLVAVTATNALQLTAGIF